METSTHVSIVDKSSRQKISKDRVELSSTISYVDPINICRTVNATVAESNYLPKFLRYAQKQTRFWTIKYTLKCKIIEIIWSVTSDNNKMKLEINDRKLIGKLPNTCRLNNTLLNNVWAKEAVLKEIKMCLGYIKMKIKFTQICGHSKICA